MIEIVDSDDDGEQQPEEAEQPEPEREEENSSSDRRTSHNPFAAFAFAEGGGGGGDGGGDENDGPLPAVTPSFPTTASAATTTKRPAPSGPAAAAAAAPAKKGKRHACGPAEDFEALGAQEREAVYGKWVGIVGKPSQEFDVDMWRFRVLAAVILSSRTQEAMVRQAVQRMAAMPGGFSVETLAALDPEDTSPLHERISFVHVNKAKSKHIVLSARRIRDELGGHVPTTMQGLLTMHGIGPTLGPLVVFLFQYHQQKMDEKKKQEEGGEEKGGPGIANENGADEKEVVVLDDSPVVKEKGRGDKVVAAEEEA